MASIPCAAYYASSQIRARQNRSRHSSGSSIDSIPDTTVNSVQTTPQAHTTFNQGQKSAQFAFNPISYVKTGPWMNATAAATTSFFERITGIVTQGGLAPGGTK